MENYENYENLEVMHQEEPMKGRLKTYPDITAEYNRTDSPATKFLLTELIIRRALMDDKGLKKKLGKCVCNRRNEDGTTTWLLGLYREDSMNEREADELILSQNVPIEKMWLIDKYSELAKEFV